LIAIDWGTTGFRAYRLDGDGAVAESRSASKGILAVPPGGFPAVLEEVGDWIAEGHAPIVMAGMVGSRQGWLEVPYVACPAGFDEIAAAMRDVRWEGRRAWIVPGLTCRDEARVPDVMRGEEAQILGALDDLPAAGALVCLPGTHSKWVRVERGRIAGFSTCMTGELYAVMKAHSILGRMMEDGAADPHAFADGVGRSGEPGGVLHHLFGVRTRGLMGELAPAAAASYLSGILIGHELRNARTGADRIHFLGAASLAERYLDAARLLEMHARTLDPDAAVRALFRLGARLRN
jgi:2-dehydro-3-deoxygalactonokinase